MKRLLLGLLLAALPAWGQVDITAAPCNMTDGSCAGSLSSLAAPSGCVSASVPFFGSDLKLGCDASLTYTTATLAAPVHAGTSFVATVPGTITITNATNATPIVVTAVAHGLRTNDRVSISGITGNTNANGYFRITRLTADTFSLQNYSTGADIAGNGAYGGTPVAVTGIVQAQRVLVGDGTAAAPGLAFAAGSGMFRGATTGAIIFATSGYGRAKIGASGSTAIQIEGASQLGWTSTGGEVTDTTGGDTFLSRGGAAATLQLGAANAASPIAQTLKFQDATGTNANAAATATIKGPAGTGTGTPGAIVFQAAVGGSSGSTAHTQTDALKIIGAAVGGVPGVVLAATQSPASNAACTAGTITWDDSYIYICTASGAWKRAALTGGY